MTTEAAIPTTSSTAKSTGEISPRIPLVIGVAGHRRILPGDEMELTKSVNAVFDELAKECPNTPITVLSPLAEGADRIVARVALERKANLIALLPMPKALFETDFKTDASRAEFERLIKSSQRVIEMALPGDVTEEQVAKDGEARDARYAAGGAMLNRSCHLLIALWDGEAAAGMGGTGDQVPFMLKGPPPQHQEVWNFLHPPNTGPVAQVFTPRSDTPKHKAGEIIWHFPSDGPWRNGQKELIRRLKQIDQFNREATSATGGDSLLPESAWKQGADSPVARMIDARYQAADRMAREVQNRSKRAYQWLSILGLLALSFYQLNSNHQTHWGGYMMLFALAMGVSIVVYLASKKGRVHERFLDNRALAEALRVQFFWNIAGIEESVLSYMPLRLHGDLSWLRLSMMDYANPPPVTQPWQATDLQLLRLAHQYWVQDQRNFFIDRAIKRREQVERVSTAQMILIVLGLIAAVLSILIQRWIGDEPRPVGALGAIPWLTASMLMIVLCVGVTMMVWARRRTTWKRIRGSALLKSPGIIYLIVGLIGAAMVVTSVIRIRNNPVPVQQAAFILNAILSIIGPVTAGVIQAYGGHFAFAEHVRRYLTMSDLFGRAERALATLLKRHDVTNTRELLFHLGHESLSESAEWLILHRERPLPLIRPKSNVDVIFQRQSSEVMLPTETEGGANRQ